MGHCGTCKHYEPTRNKDTGRILPSKPGTCAYPVKWPVLPESYCSYGRVDYPRPQPVWPGSGFGCVTFEPKPIEQVRTRNSNEDLLETIK